MWARQLGTILLVAALLAHPTGLIAVYAQAAGAPEVVTPVPPPLPPLLLDIEVEGRPLAGSSDIFFYGPRVPRVHFHGDRRITEALFFEIAEAPEYARSARVHRGVNIGLSALSILSFFGGLVLFGAADEVDLSLVGLGPAVAGRVLSISLLAGSIVPAIGVAVRGQQWAPLELTWQTMQTYNSAAGSPTDEQERADVQPPAEELPPADEQEPTENQEPAQ